MLLDAYNGGQFARRSPPGWLIAVHRRRRSAPGGGRERGIGFDVIPEGGGARGAGGVGEGADGGGGKVAGEVGEGGKGEEEEE